MITRTERRTEPVDDDIAAAKRWAAELAASAPAPDPAALELERQRYEQRQAQIRETQDAVLRGDADPPRGTTRERLALLVHGDPVTGERVPLTFESPEQFEQFKAELRAVFAKHGITDAVVQQLGSGTTGYRGNPNKESHKVVDIPSSRTTGNSAASTPHRSGQTFTGSPRRGTCASSEGATTRGSTSS